MDALKSRIDNFTLNQLSTLSVPSFEAFGSSAEPQLSDLSTIVKVRDDLVKGIQDFPRSCCETAAVQLERACPNLVYRTGIFVDHNNRGQQHAWNYSPQLDCYADITASQFNPNLPDILIVSVNSSWAQSHYLVDWFAAW